MKRFFKKLFIKRKRNINKIVKKYLIKNVTPKDFLDKELHKYEERLWNYIKKSDFHSPLDFVKKVDIKCLKLEKMLNRNFNKNYNENLHFKLKPIFNMDQDFSFLELEPINLKSELLLLGVDYNYIKKIEKNYDKFTYIIKDVSIKIGNIDIYFLKYVIGNMEIYVLKDKL